MSAYSFVKICSKIKVLMKTQTNNVAYSRIPVTKLTVKLGLAAACAYVGSLLAFPGLRLAQTHLDAVKMTSDRPLVQ